MDKKQANKKTEQKHSINFNIAMIQEDNPFQIILLKPPPTSSKSKVFLLSPLDIYHSHVTAKNVMLDIISIVC